MREIQCPTDVGFLLCVSIQNVAKILYLLLCDMWVVRYHDWMPWSYSQLFVIEYLDIEHAWSINFAFPWYLDLLLAYFDVAYEIYALMYVVSMYEMSSLLWACSDVVIMYALFWWWCHGLLLWCITGLYVTWYRAAIVMLEWILWSSFAWVHGVFWLILGSASMVYQHCLNFELGITSCDVVNMLQHGFVFLGLWLTQARFMTWWHQSSKPCPNGQIKIKVELENRIRTRIGNLGV